MLNKINLIKEIFNFSYNFIDNCNEICKIKDIGIMKQEIRKYSNFIYHKFNKIIDSNKHIYFNSCVEICRDYYLTNLKDISLIIDYEERNLQKDKFLEEFTNNIKKARLYCSENNIKIDTY